MVSAAIIFGMNYDESTAYIESLAPTILNPSLQRMSAFMSEHESLQDSFATIHIGGTNGKGSTAAILASILQAAGHHCGLYTSPHLVRVNERFRVNSADISDEDFAQSFSEIPKTVDRLIASSALDSRPSFYEYLTATAFLYFARAKIDFAVLEVGMGGRLDATNVTLPAWRSSPTSTSNIRNSWVRHTQRLRRRKRASSNPAGPSFPRARTLK